MAKAHESRRKERLDRGVKVRSDGVYAVASWREMAFLLGPRLLLIAGLLIMPLLLWPVPYWQKVLTIICIYSLLAIGFDFLAHYVGLVSLGGALYIGVGAYIAALLNTEMGLPLWATIPLATVLGGGVCTVLLWPCLPLRGVYFAIVSLMFPLLAARLIEAFDVFGGTDGVMGLDGFPNSWSEMYVLIICLLLALFALRRLVNEDVGLVFRGVKDNDQAVKASGINITTYKALGVFIASSLGCLGGACLAHIYMWAGISQFALDFSIIPIAATVVGGGGTLAGPVIGCLILVPISELLRDFGTLRIAVYALILMAFIVFKSEGLMSYGSRKYNQFEHWVEI
ncbi:MAG: branched-chain amino acid ABC transporter permease [Desulfarculaceae bacterium]|nr:branched-chain amino acid ABC transporter permease [Desulfarculaceae bacterium]MCF8047339.1 branched-chain amino acid ABC transporter permease [Desulfarculaceae bacterium]MCF8064769.1 branched-chain amino acid ABC transporter permease [Desulfarculaceae bacterium]MCF8096566.1 branched-chain amino acid ABC transporter permease [Desulfarculaceae bacterium]MCF8122122.1 branched-chain amino acid ABC transporter permease [Desulfarculaceae bacterium]